MHRRLRVMTEIKLCWSDSAPQKEEAARRGGWWLPDTLRNRDKLCHAAEAGNSLYGDQTHWNEARQA